MLAGERFVQREPHANLQETEHLLSFGSLNDAESRYTTLASPTAQP